MKSAQKQCSDRIIDVTVWPTPYNYYLNTTENFTIIELENSTGAKCIDGSNYKFGFIRGTGSGHKKFMFFFAGGGYCGFENKEFLLSCYERTSNFRGSSNFTGLNGTNLSTNFSWGYFSSDVEINPVFSNWNKVYMLYCDGTLYQGYNENPINYNGTDLWFRGYNVTVATVNYLKNHMGLFDAKEIILSGVSSGANAVLIWMPYFRLHLPSQIKLRGISDAGLFLDVKNQNENCFLYRNHMKTLFNYTKSYDLDLFFTCKYRKSSSLMWKCIVPEYIAESIEEDMFMANSQNDFEFSRTAYGLLCLDKGLTNCKDDVNEKITLFREKFLKLALKLKAKKKNWGFWLRRCLEHYYVSSIAWKENLTVFNAEKNKNLNLMGALYEWYLEGKGTSYIDLENYEIDCPTIRTEN